MNLKQFYSSTHATYWLRAASPLAPCGCCEASLNGTPATVLAAASLGVRWWPRSSVVFGEAGGVCSKGAWSEHKTRWKIMIYFMKDLMSHSQICSKVRRTFFDKSCYSGLISLTVEEKEQYD